MEMESRNCSRDGHAGYQPLLYKTIHVVAAWERRRNTVQEKIGRETEPSAMPQFIRFFFSFFPNVTFVCLRACLFACKIKKTNEKKVNHQQSLKTKIRLKEAFGDFG